MKLLTIKSKANGYELPKNTWETIENIAESLILTPGVYVLRIQSGTYSFWNSGDKKEPFVMLWIRGGKFLSYSSNVKTKASIESLKGYNDSVTINVYRSTTLYAFFIDAYCPENRGTISISIHKEK